MWEFGNETRGGGAEDATRRVEGIGTPHLGGEEDSRHLTSLALSLSFDFDLRNGQYHYQAEKLIQRCRRPTVSSSYVLCSNPHPHVASVDVCAYMHPYPSTHVYVLPEILRILPPSTHTNPESTKAKQAKPAQGRQRRTTAPKVSPNSDSDVNDSAGEEDDEDEDNEDEEEEEDEEADDGEDSR